MNDTPQNTLLKTLPLDALHRELGGKMVPFAGYEMPVQYAMGVKGEHLHVREKAGLFDVSHMGQAFLTASDHAEAASAIETLVPGEIAGLSPGRIRYTVLLADDGGVLDDLMITRTEEDGKLFLVVNAATKDADFALIEEKLAGRAKLDVLGRSLLALQGPLAHTVIGALDPMAPEMPFMSMRHTQLEGIPVTLSRCGYTGEDGYEISVANSDAEALARRLLAHEDVAPIGLGARDSLRLEAGLCLYGHDLTEADTPVSAAITFAIGKRRRQEGGFPGAERILRELKEGCEAVRVGLRPLGRAPAREGVEVRSAEGEVIGAVTSGGFGPTFDAPVAMGRVEARFAEPGTVVHLMVRGKPMEAEVVRLPFVPQRYYRGAR
ncbi:glycine cleavage system aminomethyltransferase GcvT [Parvularcula dongshanensis]|uniref:aminomethyltransferase n=1 Tax=Parvularcula dongshanensis TaxID=1173995 RepID=A0A840I0B1_9PROT|nr:glycine cleavage system aminomethyltransferase GcvT [Parvularcula dongshanensis]MBB4658506.1 aminomethyltransferase [Parvularcula dongshanensis]